MREEATRYLLDGADGNEGLASFLPEESIRVVPVSAKWFRFYDLDRVRKRAEQEIGQVLNKIPSTQVRQVNLCWERIRVVARVSSGSNDIRHRSLEEIRKAVGPLLGATTFPEVGQALESFPVPTLPAAPEVPGARASLLGPGLGVSLGVLALALLAWLVGVGPIPILAGSLAMGLVGFVGLAGFLGKRIKADMLKRVRAADETWMTEVREAIGGYARNLVREAIRVLRDVPERMESGIPELARAIEETVMKNALAMEIIEPAQSIRKRCLDWKKRLENTAKMLDAQIAGREKQIAEIERLYRLALEAVESAVSSSLSDLTTQLSRETDNIVEEINGVRAFFKMLFRGESEELIEKVKTRIQSEVVREERVEKWVHSDTVKRVESAVADVVGHLDEALGGTEVMIARELKQIAINLGVSTEELWKGGAKIGAGLASASVGAPGGAVVKSAIIGSIGGPLGTVLGVVVGCVVAIIAFIFGGRLAGEGVKFMRPSCGVVSRIGWRRKSDQALWPSSPK